ncbi:hypothetical protein V494_03332 [Pseudogymnoascus sp. VKM F-4513 (FW-928)]|nr:hypothetical protein V494_03332 [Pseudogymnoascus sp. VKM F-4513 (FW-928)]
MASATLTTGRRKSGEQVLAFIGCGTLGTGILTGIMSHVGKEGPSFVQDEEGNTEPLPFLQDQHGNHLFPPTSYIATCRSDTAVERLNAAVAEANTTGENFKVIQNDNVKACQEADVIILGCKPYMVSGILSKPGMNKALEGKLLISICAGVAAEDIENVLYGGKPGGVDRCTIVRTMPNTAAGIGQSMTVLATPAHPIDDSTSLLIETIFKCVGETVWLPPNLMDASTALCGSGPAFFLLLLEAAIDGGVAMGLPRAEATKMAAQTMKGACMGVLGDKDQGRAPVHPAVLKDRVTTPGGCTIGGLMVLEDGGARGIVSKAIRAATVVASKLGAGVKNVNGANV